MKRILLISFFFFLVFAAQAQYYGQVWMKATNSQKADTLEGLILINPRLETVSYIDSTSREWVYDYNYIYGFIWTDQFFYEKPEFQYLPRRSNRNNPDIHLFQVVVKGPRLWLVEMNKIFYAYHPKNDRINKIEDEKDLFKNLEKKDHQEITEMMQRELWHWSLDMSKIIKFYNQI